MDDLVAWLSAQIDEDERIARAATPGPWVWSREFVTPPGYHHRTVGPLEPGDSAHIAAHDPARVLREIAAKRAVLARYVKSVDSVRELDALRDHLKAKGMDLFMTDTELGSVIQQRDALLGVLRLLALPYADRPGYRDEWRP
ncbi:DUF6221 family protein [Streptomyces sp. NPDC008150]|uniref:DUF6221 family protein n=1 Tax=Streptomyces sp. NPDC008150 TaxID=3364816 RepID=UPI0036F18FC9